MTNCPNADGSSERITQFAEQPPMCIDTTKNYTATMETSMGDMIIHLDAVNAPLTVNNFVFLSRYHYYDGLIFHRIINGFMCQGGCPEGSGRGGPGYRFEDELPAPGRYEIGSIAMANAGPNTNGSQFFITLGPCDWMNGGYVGIGRVVQGFDVLEKISNCEVSNQKPSPPILCTKSGLYDP